MIVIPDEEWWNGLSALVTSRVAAATVVWDMLA
jgi:hypothetical protein